MPRERQNGVPADVSSEEKPVKKPRKKVEVSEKMRAACQANAAKAREVRAQKKLAKLAAESETQTILNELVAEKKRAKAAKKEEPVDDFPPTPVFGKPEKPSKKKHVPLSESEESEESEASELEQSEESEESSSEDSDVEFVLKPAKKKAAAKKTTRNCSQEKAPRNERARSQSTIMEKMAAMEAEIAALRKEKKKSKPAPVNVYVGGRQANEKKTPAELDVLAKWARDD